MKVSLTKAVEMRLRRRVQDTGHSLHKSRRDIGPDNLGGYRIVDPYYDRIIAGEKFDLDADEVGAWVDSLGGWSVKLYALKKLNLPR